MDELIIYIIRQTGLYAAIERVLLAVLHSHQEGFIDICDRSRDRRVYRFDQRKDRIPTNRSVPISQCHQCGTLDHWDVVAGVIKLFQ